MSVVDQLAELELRRPLRADARRNYDALIAAARDAFATSGPDASLEDIARRADVGIGTLYRNFPSRDTLIEAVYVAEVTALARVAEQSAALPPLEAFEVWLARFVEYVGTKRALVDGINKASGLFQTCRAVMYASGGPVLERAQAAGDIRDDVAIGDVVHLISGIAGVQFGDAAQRARVLAIAVDGLRAH
jgi:AcrR family transcriptional regulator